jgi:hypothetical protein
MAFHLIRRSRRAFCGASSVVQENGTVNYSSIVFHVPHPIFLPSFGISLSLSAYIPASISTPQAFLHPRPFSFCFFSAFPRLPPPAVAETVIRAAANAPPSRSSLLSLSLSLSLSAFSQAPGRRRGKDVHPRAPYEAATTMSH